jgi:hypothetical protein
VNIISQEIVTLFALNGRILWSKLSMNVMCPCGLIAATMPGALSGVVVIV